VGDARGSSQGMKGTAGIKRDHKVISAKQEL
jgi:hypothetical protein